MPISLLEYSLADWLHLRPVTHNLKQYRYRTIDRAHSRRPPRAGELAHIRQDVRGRRVLITVAYGDAEAIEWQSTLVQAFVPDALYLVADNSPDAATARSVSAVAQRRNVPYVWLPEITWRRGVISRSHGLAMNWVWRNVVLPGRPEAFGFLDHDMFPTEPDDPFAPLATQPCYGHVRPAGSRWFLWAGFCMFKFSEVEHRRLDFGQDWFSGLDTGGGNWRPLYQGLDLAKLQIAPYREFFYRNGVTANEAQMHRLGAWLHEVGVRDDQALRADKRRALVEMLQTPLRQARGEPAMAKDPT